MKLGVISSGLVGTSNEASGLEQRAAPVRHSTSGATRSNILKTPLSLPSVRCGGRLEQTTIFRLRTLLATSWFLSRAVEKMGAQGVDTSTLASTTVETNLVMFILPPLQYRVTTILLVATCNADAAADSLLEDCLRGHQARPGQHWDPGSRGGLWSGGGGQRSE